MAQAALQASQAGREAGDDGALIAELEARNAELEAQVTELMTEAEQMGEESLGKDEEIEALEGRLAHALQQQQPAPAPAQVWGPCRHAPAVTPRGRSDSAHILSELNVSIHKRLCGRCHHVMCAYGAWLRACVQGAVAGEVQQLRGEAAAANAEVVLLGDALAAKEDELAALQAQLQAAQAEAVRLSDALSSKCGLLLPTHLPACPLLHMSPISDDGLSCSGRECGA